MIFLGCTMGTVLEKTGAAIRITKWAIGLFGKDKMIWGIALASFILGIPIFADTVVILLIPIVSLLAVQTKKSMMCYGTVLYLGALVTASLVPPTPGPVSAAALLNVPLGQAIIWGLLTAVPSVIAATLYCMTLKTPVLPKEEFIKAAKEAVDGREMPGLTKALAPIIVPLALIVCNTGASILVPDTAIANFLAFIGSPLATFVKNAGVADRIAEVVVQSSFPAILIPIIIAAIIHVVTGSNALGVMTAAALVEPMLGTLGISPVAAFLACGTGALMFKHANSSGFWVTVSMSNMDVNQGIRAVGGASTVAGLTGAILTCILWGLHLI